MGLHGSQVVYGLLVASGFKAVGELRDFEVLELMAVGFACMSADFQTKILEVPRGLELKRLRQQTPKTQCRGTIETWIWGRLRISFSRL